ncbi:MAG: hypothetical protein JWO60_1073, partial [Frankiales bacterium]|nr:hypothetical protein [Frankiales bacterium]
AILVPVEAIRMLVRPARPEVPGVAEIDAPCSRWSAARTA